MIHTNPLGYSFPAGAENDPNAPYNQSIERGKQCEQCGAIAVYCDCPRCDECYRKIQDDDNGLCVECENRINE